MNTNVYCCQRFFGNVPSRIRAIRNRDHPDSRLGAIGNKVRMDKFLFIRNTFLFNSLVDLGLLNIIFSISLEFGWYELCSIQTKKELAQFILKTIISDSEIFCSSGLRSNLPNFKFYIYRICLDGKIFCSSGIKLFWMVKFFVHPE